MVVKKKSQQKNKRLNEFFIHTRICLYIVYYCVLTTYYMNFCYMREFLPVGITGTDSKTRNPKKNIIFNFLSIFEL